MNTVPGPTGVCAGQPAARGGGKVAAGAGAGLQLRHLSGGRPQDQGANLLTQVSLSTTAVNKALRSLKVYYHREGPF